MRTLAWLGAVLSLMLLASACGSSDGSADPGPLVIDPDPDIDEPVTDQPTVDEADPPVTDEPTLDDAARARLAALFADF